jgi:hypothetical protein
LVCRDDRRLLSLIPGDGDVAHAIIEELRLFVGAADHDLVDHEQPRGLKSRGESLVVIG